MLDHADLIAINKFDRRGSEDALRDVRRQIRRTGDFPLEVQGWQLPVFGTIASQFGDRGVTALYLALLNRLGEKLNRPLKSSLTVPDGVVTGERHPIIPESRVRYLGEIAEALRTKRDWVEKQVAIARRLYQLDGARQECKDERVRQGIGSRYETLRKNLEPECWELIQGWEELRRSYEEETFSFGVRDRKVEVPTSTETFSHTRVPRVALPRFEDWGEILKFRLKENVPGTFPYTAGVYPFKRKRGVAAPAVCRGRRARADEPAFSFLESQRRGETPVHRLR